MKFFINSILWLPILMCLSCSHTIVLPDEDKGEDPTANEIPDVAHYPTSPSYSSDGAMKHDELGSHIGNYKADKVACVLDISVAVGDDESSSSSGRNVYSAEYIMEVAGLPCFTTNDLANALEKSRLMLVSSAIREGTFSAEQMDEICKWVYDGGIIIAPAITQTGTRIQELFGVTSTSYNKKRRFIEWDNVAFNMHECHYFDCEQEHVISLSDGKNKHPETAESIKTYGYEVSGSALRLASFNSGEAAIVRNNFGKGCAYTFGLLWRDVVARPQMGKSFSASRGSWDSFETSYDAFPLFLRSTWSKDVPAVSKFTIPDGWQGLLIPTHDCDSKTAYEEMHWMSDYERALGVSGHYFLTTHYFRDEGYLSAFYDSLAIENTDLVLKAGHTIGSHSISHFPDFDNASRFPIVEVDKDSYRPHHDKETGITTGGSSWAETVLSKRIIEDCQSVIVRSFRPGHMCHSSILADALTMGGFSFSSASQGNILLSSFPFTERAGRDWSNILTPILEIPLHFSDVSHGDMTLNGETWKDFADQWVDFIAKQTGNYAPSVLLIHPNKEYKMSAEKHLIDNMAQNKIGLYNFEDYGDFWLRRRKFDFTTSYDPDSGKMYIQATANKINECKGLALMVEFNGETSSAPTSVTLIDDKGNVHETSSYKLLPSNERFLIVIR